MAISNFIPAIWSARLLRNLNREHVYVARMNRDYEGEISNFGDSVRIHTVGRITVVDYVKNVTTLTPENVDADTVVLHIDQSKAFSFEIDDIDTAQQKPKVMDDFMEEAAFALNDDADSAAATTLTNGVATANLLTAATSVGTGAGDDDAYEILVDLGVKLTENNVPKANRWVVVPPFFEGYLLKDPRFVSFGTGENLGRLTNGLIGRAAGFTVHVSNNVPVSGNAHDILAGVPSAAAWAGQIRKTEPFRPEGSFSDAMKGLHLYGRKVLDPTRLAKIVATDSQA